MARRFIDISAPLRNDVCVRPAGHSPRIEYIDHQQSLPQILPFFAGLRKEDLPDGQGWAIERVSADNAQRHASRRALALPSDNE